MDAAGLSANSIVPVQKTLVMDMLANGWPVELEKAEGLAIIDEHTIAIVNDNDYGQVSVPQDGIAVPTGINSHLITYGLNGANTLPGYKSFGIALSQGKTAVSSSQTPYLTPIGSGVSFTSILTTTDAANNGYKMVGIPDGLGAFDNYDGTFTLLMNHELGNTQGAVRSYGSRGAFVSKWIIRKYDLAVLSGSDLTQNLKLWNTTTSSYETFNSTRPYATGLNRFCSADLPKPTAFFNPNTGRGTQNKIFMDGEEAGVEGRAFAHIVTGPEAGNSYELPRLGKFSWENSLANPAPSDWTIIAEMMMLRPDKYISILE